MSSRAVLSALGIVVEDIPDWVCCGSTPAHASSPAMASALPAINLAKAKEMDLSVLTACASCYSRLRVANYKIKNSDQEKEMVKRLIDKQYDGNVEVLHILDLLVNRFGPDKINKSVKKPLAGLKVASYYGCLLTRPPEISAFEDSEHPRSMDRLVEAAGATMVDWPFRTECCGASLSITNSDATGRLTYKLLSMAQEAGANCIAVACPLCQSNLDLRQEDADSKGCALKRIPVLYITQIIGLALGLSYKELGLDKIIVSADSLLKSIGIDDGGLR